MLAALFSRYMSSLIDKMKSRLYTVRKVLEVILESTDDLGVENGLCRQLYVSKQNASHHPLALYPVLTYTFYQLHYIQFIYQIMHLNVFITYKVSSSLYGSAIKQLLCFIFSPSVIVISYKSFIYLFWGCLCLQLNDISRH